MIRKDKRRGSRSAFATVDRDVVDSAVTLRHGTRQVSPELLIADRGLDADRDSTGRFGDLLNKVQHRVHAGKRRVRRRTRAVLVHGDAADAGDLRSNLRGWQETTHARFGSLTELQFDGSDGVLRDALFEFVQRKLPVVVAAAEVARTDLPDQIAAVQMMFGDSALTRVVQTACQLAALVQSGHGRSTQRAVAHAADVDDGLGAERLRAVSCCSQNFGTRDFILGTVPRHSLAKFGKRKGGLLHDEVVGRLLQVVVGAEAEVVVLLLRRGVDPRPLITTEWPLFVIACDDVLPKLGPDHFEQIAKVSDDRKVSQDGVLLLQHVPDGQQQNQAAKYSQCLPENVHITPP